MFEGLDLQAVKIRDIISSEPVIVHPSMSIRDAARLMHSTGKSYVLLADVEIKGIVTEGDIKRAVANEVPVTTPLSKIATTNLITIDEDSTLFDAIVLFFKNRIRHLPVKRGKKIVGVISINDVLLFASRIPFYFLDSSAKAQSIDELGEIYRKLNTFIIENLARDEYVNPVDFGKILGYINDQILRSVVRLSIDELGSPPSRFSLFVMGSEGRFEQLIKSDQDNALVFENDAHREYFVELGSIIHSNLLRVGFPECRGNYTVGNEEWVRSAEEWMKLIAEWEIIYSPENLLKISIFSDMRFVYGDVSLFNLLKSVLFRLGEKDVIFIKLLVEALKFRPPIGFAGRLTSDVIDLKKDAVTPVVAPVRVLSLRFGVRAYNTAERIEELAEKGAISKELAANLKTSYVFLKRMQFLAQVANIRRGKEKINLLNLKELPKLRVEFIKDSLKSVAEFQKMVAARYL
ncbi:DUF294 nucleotidyltransferase-like domain-containing protein [Archaeoglobus veneficus]|uniref:Putative signal transduction protein with CBS domains n=1 Tax=Archaeoglobus veneficus (strain DSM 11195 / SNP6) TaxID=693661 RepID=F2KPD4_ARCVS|nr:DUF294 nucleotidyltransferase-like domain-containing protein [Archaeoglobus veneficus]AEA46365.1 putative signal transduction protein with CBS domains [Archaeoglobus veneficus SNP6]